MPIAIMPSIDEILFNPTAAKILSEPCAQIAIATALGRVLSNISLERGITYLERMPTEMRVMAMRDAAASDADITHTPDFVRFGVEYRRSSNDYGEADTCRIISAYGRR